MGWLALTKLGMGIMGHVGPSLGLRVDLGVLCVLIISYAGFKHKLGSSWKVIKLILNFCFGWLEIGLG